MNGCQVSFRVVEVLQRAPACPVPAPRLKEMVLKWLPVASNKAIDNESPELGESPIKKGKQHPT